MVKLSFIARYLMERRVAKSAMIGRERCEVKDSEGANFGRWKCGVVGKSAKQSVGKSVGNCDIFL